MGKNFWRWSNARWRFTAGQAWNVDTGSPGVVFEHWYHNPYVATVDNDRVLVSGLRHGGLRLHDLHSGAVERHYEKDSNIHLSAFQLAADHQSFIGILQEREGRVIRRWDIDSGDIVAEWSIPAQHRREDFYGRHAYQGLALAGSRLFRFDQVQAPRKLPDGSIDWGRVDLLLQDWTTQEVTNRITLPAHGRFSIVSTADGAALAAVGSDEMISRGPRNIDWGSTYLLIWDVAAGKERVRVEVKCTDYHSAFASVAISPDARLAATASHRNRIDIWNGLTGKLLQTLETTNDIVSLKFAQNGDLLASGHQDGSVYLWDTRPAWSLVNP